MAKPIKPRAAKLKNCPYCQKLYRDNGQGYCSACAEKIREMEKAALEYVEKNPDVSPSEVAEATGVPEKIIISMIQNGQFVDSGINMSYPCSMCGRPINAGFYCLSCKEKMLSSFQRFRDQREARIKSGRDGIKSDRKRLSQEDFGSNRFKSILGSDKGRHRRK